MTLMQVGLDDKYRLDAKRINLSGIQALVRLPMLQRERDRLEFQSQFVRSPQLEESAGSNIQRTGARRALADIRDC